MVLLLFGPPGCGKGTQSRLIANWLNIPAISTGEMLRAAIRAGTALGEAAQSVMASGGLVSDDLINEMLRARVCQDDCEKGLMLDGYPRTVEQAEFLDGVLVHRNMPSPVVLHFDVPSDALVGRMTSRRECPACSRIYNLLSEPPKSPGVCDADATPLITRKDDQEHVFRERLRMYEEVTRPVLAYYQYRNYYQIRGDRSAGYIFEAITGILEPLVSNNGQ
ncbi:MAG: adenylate kinase [Bryobacteraceae bacterium]